MEVTVKCGECGDDLKIKLLELGWRDEDLEISVDVCTTCTTKAKEGAVEEALEKAREEAEEQEE